MRSSKRFLVSVVVLAVAAILLSCERPKPVARGTQASRPVGTSIPEEFQGVFVSSNGKDESYEFIARKGDKWRVDMFIDANRRHTTIRSDRLYSVSHERRIFSAFTYMDSGTEHERIFALFDDLTNRFFREERYEELAEVSKAGDLRTYRKNRNEQNVELVTVDAQTNMIMRREGPVVIDAGSIDANIYELRDLSFTVDDSVFEMPPDYTEVPWQDYLVPLR